MSYSFLNTAEQEKKTKFPRALHLVPTSAAYSVLPAAKQLASFAALLILITATPAKIPESFSYYSLIIPNLIYAWRVKYLSHN